MRRMVLIGLTGLALCPALAWAQQAYRDDGGRYGPSSAYRRDYEDAQSLEPPPGDCDDRCAPAGPDGPPPYVQDGYRRDWGGYDGAYYPPPYGYTYGSANGYGYGYSYPGRAAQGRPDGRPPQQAYPQGW